MTRRKRKKYMWICLISGDMPYRQVIEKELLSRTRKAETAHYPSKIPVYRVPIEERENFEQWIFTEGSEELVYDRILKVTHGNQGIGLTFTKSCAMQYLIEEKFRPFKHPYAMKTGKKARVRREKVVTRRRRRKKTA